LDDSERRLAPSVERAEPRQRAMAHLRGLLSPAERRGDVVFAPQDTTRVEVVRVAGTRWVIEQRFEAAKGEGGLDHEEVRSWTGWDSPYDPRHGGLSPVERLAGGDDRGGGI
jgi:SRSO17 transposase